MTQQHFWLIKIDPGLQVMMATLVVSTNKQTNKQSKTDKQNTANNTLTNLHLL